MGWPIWSFDEHVWTCFRYLIPDQYCSWLYEETRLPLHQSCTGFEPERLKPEVRGWGSIGITCIKFRHHPRKGCIKRENGGVAGIRTPVQRKNEMAFYMLRQRSDFRMIPGSLSALEPSYLLNFRVPSKPFVLLSCCCLICGHLCSRCQDIGIKGI